MRSAPWCGCSARTPTTGSPRRCDDALGPDDDIAVEPVTGSWDLPGARLLDLVAVMDRLRSPGGCPWDAEQTHESLVEYLVEEAYETVEAIETGDDAALREELGDLLLQVVFHARIAQEHDEPWTIDDVAAGIVDKLVAPPPARLRRRRRHDGGAGRGELADAQERREGPRVGDRRRPGGAARRSSSPPSCSSARAPWVGARRPRGGRRGGRGGRRRSALRAATRETAYGDLLLALVARAREDGVDPDVALRAAARRYRAAVRSAEGLA